MQAKTTLIEFHGDQLEVVENDTGRPFASIRRMCENLGLGYSSQRQKLHEAEWAVVTMIVTTGSDGKLYEQAMLDIDCVAMWLATINPRKVAESLRPHLIVYQKECQEVLNRHFRNDGISVNGDSLRVVTAQVADLQQQIIAINQRMATQHGQLLELYRELLPIVKRIDDRTKGNREEIAANDKRRIIAEVQSRYQGRCPCCHSRLIVKDGKRIADVAQFDHWHHRSMSQLQYVWLVCKTCNRKLRDRKPNGFWMQSLPAFQQFQRLLHTSPHSLLFSPEEIAAAKCMNHLEFVMS